MSFEPILLTPEEELAETYPYRRVWRTAWTEVLLILIVVLAVYLPGGFLGLASPNLGGQPVKLGLALSPLLAWLLVSYRAERRAERPRPGLARVMVLGALVANAIAVPLQDNVFTPELWLPTSGFFGRVFGYATTLGFTAVFLKFLVIRFTVWPADIRRRVDGVAYSLAASIGYATVFNVRFVLLSDATSTAIALRVASITLSQLGIGVLIGFFLAELVIGRTTVFWIPLGLGLSAFLHGLYYAFRGIAIVGSPGVDATGSSPILGLALVTGLVVLLFVSTAFIIQNADTRMEALTGTRSML